MNKFIIAGFMALIMSICLGIGTESWGSKKVYYTVVGKDHVKVPCGKHNQAVCDEFYLSLQNSKGMPVVKTVNYGSYVTLKAGTTVSFQEPLPDKDGVRLLSGVLIAVGLCLIFWGIL